MTLIHDFVNIGLNKSLLFKTIGNDILGAFWIFKYLPFPSLYSLFALAKKSHAGLPDLAYTKVDKQHHTNPNCQTWPLPPGLFLSRPSTCGPTAVSSPSSCLSWESWQSTGACLHLMRSTVNFPLSTVIFQMSAVNWHISTVRSKMSAVNYPLSTFRCQLSAVNCHLAPFTCQLSAVKCQLSTVN